MSTAFMESITNATNVAHTENGAMAFATTKDRNLDLFAQGGALRNRDDNEALTLFSSAYAEDALLATRAMFYFRDARGGQGERDTFRKQLKWLSATHPQVVLKNLELVPHYGRWDDLYVLFDTPLQSAVIKLFKHQLTLDVCADRPSILAKWLKSENTSSKESQRLGRKTRVGLEMTSKDYRTMLSDLRKRINIVERLVSAGEWDKVAYEAVPSQANIKYNRAFFKHDSVRRTEFLAALKEGKTKVNASVLFPYEIVRQVRELGHMASSNDRALYDGLWNALPNYIGDNQENAIAVVDVSGSMHGLPLDVAISVGMYLAERNSCEFYKNKFITFSNKPQIVDIVGSDIVERVANMSHAQWDMNTNIHAVFQLILNVAKKNNLTQDQIPHKLYIISDMEFDNATTPGGWGNDSSFVEEKLFQRIAREFRDAGYSMPNLVFWNVDSRNAQFPMSIDDRGFQMVSGCSPSIFANTMKGTFLSAQDLMLEVLNGERYQQVVI